LPDTGVFEIALRYGFSSAATFARAFKSHFGMSATQWRDGGARQWHEARHHQSKQGKAKRNPGQANRNRRKASPWPIRHHPAIRGKGIAMQVEIREVPPYRVAYVRHVGPYGEGGDITMLWTRFERWIRVRNLRQPGTLTIGIGHDAPRIAAPEKLRYDACVVVGEDFKPDRFVNVADLPGGRYAIAPFEGTAAEIAEAWDRLFTVWLPGSGYQPEDRPCLELRWDHETRLAASQLRCELCLPIGPL
jgi:AraC family transcriptional regulator